MDSGRKTGACGCTPAQRHHPLRREVVLWTERRDGWQHGLSVWFGSSDHARPDLRHTRTEFEHDDCSVGDICILSVDSIDFGTHHNFGPRHNPVTKRDEGGKFHLDLCECLDGQSRAPGSPDSAANGGDNNGSGCLCCGSISSGIPGWGLIRAWRACGHRRGANHVSTRQSWRRKRRSQAIQVSSV